MKEIQCTGCGQVFWTDLQLDENLVSSGEWVRNPCPKCGTEWAVVEPGADAPGGVSPTTVVAWEGGKYRPRDGKVNELSNLAQWDKAEVRNSLANKESKPAEEKSAEESPVEKTQIKGKRRTRRKAVQKTREER